MIRVLTVMAATAVLGGCALLSTPDPVQLYRFGGGTITTGAAPVGATQVQMRRIEMVEAAQGDRILTLTGAEAAYLQGARWVSPAEQLYSDSLEAAFASQSTSVRLIGLRELTPATRTLDVDVPTFEARYASAGAAPVVVIEARARLLRLPERTVVAEERFHVEVPASENRVGPIVAAFQSGVDDLNGQIVDWTESNAR